MCDLALTWLHSSTSTQLISFLLWLLLILKKSCYLINEGAMGLDGVLASVFIPPQISPDANLMEKHRSAEIRLQGGGAGLAPPLALLSLADLSLF